MEPPVPSRGKLAFRDLLTREVLQRVEEVETGGKSKSVAHTTIGTAFDFCNGEALIDRGLAF